MRATRWGSCLAVTMMLAACSQAASTHRTPEPSDLLVLNSTSGLTALNSATGSVLFTGEATPALANAEYLLTTTQVGDSTTVHVIGAATGDDLVHKRLHGDLTIRAVSSDGNLVALMPPLGSGESPWVPEPRAFTDIVVADPRGMLEAQRYHLEGNFEPEAFSTDGTGLFLIKYVPPTTPIAYRVVQLDLANGKVSDVWGRDKVAPHDMSGSRLMQVPSADGTMLFTLYTSQPPEYAKGHDAAQAHSGHPVAFVHTLSMREGWAHCVGIPTAFSTGDPRDEALAASSDGAFLYLIDTAKRLVAVMNTKTLVVIRSARVDFARTGHDQTHAAMSPDGRTLVVAAGARVTTIDTASLQAVGTWRTASPVDGLGYSDDGKRLYVVMDGEVQVLDASTGDRIRTIDVTGATGMQYVGPLDP